MELINMPFPTITINVTLPQYQTVMALENTLQEEYKRIMKNHTHKKGTHRLHLCYHMEDYSDALTEHGFEYSFNGALISAAAHKIQTQRVQEVYFDD
jgi:hypothetical protein